MASPFTLYDVPESAGAARALAVTADGAIWCVVGSAGTVVRLTPDGEQIRHELGAAAEPHSVAAATRDSVWVTDRGSDRVLRIDASGIVGSVVVPTPRSGPAGIVGLDDGSAWFVEEFADALGHVDILGRVAEFDTGVPGGAPVSIASDGSSVWFALPGEGAVARARGGDSLPGLVRFDDPRAAPADVGVGGDGCLWFADPARHLVGRVSRGGAVAEFVPASGSARPTRVAADRRDGCWFLMEDVGELGHLDGSGRITIIAVPDDRGAPVAIAVAPSGDVWLALECGVLARLHSSAGLAAHIQ